MSTFASAARSRTLSVLTGNAAGRPDWVNLIELGDDEGFFGPDSAAWVVHGGMPTLVAGIRALLMQTLHPGAMAGVHDWSRYKEDPLGRLGGTIQWLISVTFSDRAMAVRESDRVGHFHDRVRGTYVDARGITRDYFAGDAELLSWVHVVFTDAFLRCHLLWGKPIPGGSDQYVREWTKAGDLVGVVDPPASESELAATLEGFRAAGILKSDERVAEAVRFIRRPGLPRVMMPAYRILFAGAVASIPVRYRRMLGLRRAWWPAVTITRAVLAIVGGFLGKGSTSEDAARRRLVRLGLLSSDRLRPGM
ncbi:MAG: hypothetical protein JWO10_1144 [Microbacteriaceae bacterium]|nr:hypothetical protein [Microbacteriaceae bacterium]